MRHDREAVFLRQERERENGARDGSVFGEVREVAAERQGQDG